VITGTLVLLAVGLVFAARRTLTLGPPHRRSRPSAIPSRDLQERIDQEVHQAAAANVADAIATALAIVGEHLRFGLNHPTSLSFDRPRAGNCVEYAHLFGTVFEQIAARAGLAARAQVVRSYDARIFGLRLPFRSWRDHDWVLIDGGAGFGRRYIDPAFADALLGADLGSNVKGLE
jgi:hypothetical protein